MELAVTIALIGIVGTIATSITLMVIRSQQDFNTSAQNQKEAYMLEGDFCNWMMAYDTRDYVFIVQNNAVKADLKDNTESSVTSMLMFSADENKLSFAGSSMPDRQTETVASVQFSLSGRTICCVISFKDTQYTHKILYTVMAAEIKAAEME